eukprot:gnl/Spiro4/21051_TR10271_c1_g1_i1.p1 gnl/Spiro4/21051_TR10271_c1_g1~~gnl/Spiro4/21051_TR10271_c1_g1_i1.p1  ORF type:complete len:182 (-),score=34.72 gnl/Spiro4/21051_TR10271_c1_g1_i1:54-599(-)
MNERHFWDLISDAWQCHPSEDEVRCRWVLALLDNPDYHAQNAQRVCTALNNSVLPSLRKRLHTLSPAEVAQFDVILVEKLYTLDRREIQNHTDGCDEGFLYRRGFIVALGAAYFRLINERPSRALIGLECEDLCYLPLHVYRNLVGRSLPTPLGSAGVLSRTSGSNTAGWPPPPPASGSSF